MANDPKTPVPAISARQAFASVQSGVPTIVKAMEDALKQGLVRKVYFEKDKAPNKGTFFEFLKKWNLISATPVEGQRARGSGGFDEIAKVVGSEAQTWKDLTKKINEKLEKAGSTKRLQPYVRTLGEVESEEGDE